MQWQSTSFINLGLSISLRNPPYLSASGCRDVANHGPEKLSAATQGTVTLPSSEYSDGARLRQAPTDTVHTTVALPCL